MRAFYDVERFALYYTKQFRSDLHNFLKTYDANYRFSQNTKRGYCFYDSHTKSYKFLNSRLSDENKLYFVACFAYVIAYEKCFFHMLPNKDYTFECCESFCRITGYPMISSGPGGGVLGAFYQLCQFRLIPYDEEGRKSLADIIRSANDYMKEHMKKFVEGEQKELLSHDYDYILEKMHSCYPNFDSFWLDIVKGLSTIYNINPETLYGYREWLRKQKIHHQKECKIFDYFLDKENGYRRDLDNLLPKINAENKDGIIFAKQNANVAFEKLSDTQEKDVYFRVCWVYTYALLKELGNCKDSFVRLVRFPASLTPYGVVKEMEFFNIEIGMTPQQTELFIRMLEEMSWPMETYIHDFLTNKHKCYAGNEDYEKIVLNYEKDADYIWEQILNTVEHYKNNTVKVEITDNLIRIKTCWIFTTDIELIKVESTDVDFYIGSTTIQESQWRCIMDLYPGTSRYPVLGMSFEYIDVFIKRLSYITGISFRLPTANEWMYAAKGGKKSKGFKFSGSDNLEEVAWCRYNSEHKIHEVGMKKPNELGLYDMSGNVWEIVSDDINNIIIPKKTWDIGVACGGCAHDKENYCSTDSISTLSNSELMIAGFRLACTL